MELELAYFEQVAASPALTLMRLAGAFTDGEPGPEPPVLIVRNGDAERRVPALGAAPAAEPNGTAWRAAFGVPADLVEAGTVYLLDVGREIPLPTPHLRGEDEHASVPPAGAAASPLRPGAAKKGRGGSDSILVTPAARGVPSRDPSFRRIAGILLALVVVGVGGAWIAGAFSGTTATPAASAPRTPAAPATPTQAPASTAAETTPVAATPIVLTPLPGTRSAARARATLEGSRLSMRLTGLGPGTFQVWLYDSVIRSEPLGPPLKGPAATLRVTLPAGGAGYRFIDVSREGDANPGHSGRSVVRVPLATLRRAGGATPAG